MVKGLPVLPSVRAATPTRAPLPARSPGILRQSRECGEWSEESRFVGPASAGDIAVASSEVTAGVGHPVNAVSGQPDWKSLDAVLEANPPSKWFYDSIQTYLTSFPIDPAKARKLDEVRWLLKKSRTGSESVRLWQSRQIPVYLGDVRSVTHVGFGEEKGHPNRVVALVLEDNVSVTEAALILAHELNHAEFAVQGRTPRVDESSRSDFVAQSVEEEVLSQLKSILVKDELIARGVKIPELATGEPGFREAYSLAADLYRSQHSSAASDEVDAYATSEGKAFFREQFMNSSFKMLDYGMSYREYLEKVWDEAHPPSDEGSSEEGKCASSAPQDAPQALLKKLEPGEEGSSSDSAEAEEAGAAGEAAGVVVGAKIPVGASPKPKGEPSKVRELLHALAQIEEEREAQPRASDAEEDWLPRDSEAGLKPNSAGKGLATSPDVASALEQVREKLGEHRAAVKSERERRAGRLDWKASNLERDLLLEVRAENRANLRRVTKALLAYFKPSTGHERVGPAEEGEFDIDLGIQAQLRFRATGEKDPNVYTNEGMPQERQAAAMLAIDFSGSMVLDGRHHSARCAEVLFTDALNAVRIPHGTLGFNDVAFRIHDVKRHITDPELQHRFVPDGETATQDALLLAEEMLSRVPRNHQKIIFVLTDGAGDMETRSTIRELKRKNIVVVGVGIGVPAATMAELYDRYLAAADTTELSQKFPSFMTRELTRPTKRKSA